MANLLSQQLLQRYIVFCVAELRVRSLNCAGVEAAEGLWLRSRAQLQSQWQMRESHAFIPGDEFRTCLTVPLSSGALLGWKLHCD